MRTARRGGPGRKENLRFVLVATIRGPRGPAPVLQRVATHQKDSASAPGRPPQSISWLRGWPPRPCTFAPYRGLRYHNRQGPACPPSPTRPWLKELLRLRSGKPPKSNPRRPLVPCRLADNRAERSARPVRDAPVSYRVADSCGWICLCSTRRGSWTVTQRPPVGRGVMMRVPSCAWVMLLTIARPRPTPAWSLCTRWAPR